MFYLRMYIAHLFMASTNLALHPATMLTWGTLVISLVLFFAYATR